jgi:hypothetical protein
MYICIHIYNSLMGNCLLSVEGINPLLLAQKWTVSVYASIHIYTYNFRKTQYADILRAHKNIFCCIFSKKISNFLIFQSMNGCLLPTSLILEFFNCLSRLKSQNVITLWFSTGNNYLYLSKCIYTSEHMHFIYLCVYIYIYMYICIYICKFSLFTIMILVLPKNSAGLREGSNRDPLSAMWKERCPRVMLHTAIRNY